MIILSAGLQTSRLIVLAGAIASNWLLPMAYLQ
jgi:hypothetical protein